MHHPNHGRPDPLAIKPDPSKAAAACRQLIRAYLADPNALAAALASALAAFQLPADFIDTEGGRWK